MNFVSTRPFRGQGSFGPRAGAHLQRCLPAEGKGSSAGARSPVWQAGQGGSSKLGVAAVCGCSLSWLPAVSEVRRSSAAADSHVPGWSRSLLLCDLYFVTCSLTACDALAADGVVTLRMNCLRAFGPAPGLFPTQSRKDGIFT